MRKQTARRSPASMPGKPQNREEDIRRLAYEMYELRGREDGHDLDDWLRAEEEITGKHARAALA